MSTANEGESYARKLRILVIAYEYPPSPSPQSLRWAYLSERLAELGHEIHIMTPDISGNFAGLPDQSPDIQIHRVYPGPVRAFLGWLASRRPLPATDQATHLIASVEAAAAIEPPSLNWKGHLLERFQQVVSWMLFPDLRGEWLRPALRALPELLNQISPDVVVSSHEPATTLQIGLVAKASGYPWVADLGDPVLAAYTPRRWQQQAMKLEETVLRQADQVLVTTLETVERLRARHRVGTPVTVLEQGFDDRVPAQQHRLSDVEAPLELLYSGSFYSFRDPSALVKAVLDVSGIRLSIASGNVPDWLLAEAAAYPDRLRLLGRVPHRQLLDLQRQTDVLVNLANRDPAQVPGKFYEYLGAGRPILHVRAAGQDAASILLGKLQRGWSIPGTREGIVKALTDLRLQHEADRLHAGLDVSADVVEHWSWTAAATRLETMLSEAVSRGTR